MEELLKDELGHLNLSGRVMKTEKFPRGGGGFGDIWRGRVDDAEVAIKIPKIYATHTERQTQKVAKVSPYHFEQHRSSEHGYNLNAGGLYGNIYLVTSSTR